MSVSQGVIYKICMYVYFFVVLNLVFICSSLPIVTFPASTAATFGVVRQAIRTGNLDVFKPYWSYFRENMKQSLISGWLIIAIDVFLAWDVYLVLHIQIEFRWVMAVVLIFCFASCSAIFLNIFSLMVHSDISTKQLLTRAAILGVYKPHLTLLNFILLAGLFVLSEHFSFLFFTCLFSVGAYVTYWINHLKLKSMAQPVQ